MKIFLTEFISNNNIYSGPNIVAEDLRTAKLAAFENGLEVVGELDSLYVTNILDLKNEHGTKTKYKDNVIPFPKNRTIH
jgi:hypothetical protein